MITLNVLKKNMGPFLPELVLFAIMVSIVIGLPAFIAFEGVAYLLKKKMNQKCPGWAHVLGLSVLFFVAPLIAWASHAISEPLTIPIALAASFISGLVFGFLIILIVNDFAQTE